MSRTVVCYGDSNTWGYTPGSGVRFDEKTRWTGRLQTLLGEEYRVAECGMNARTTSFDDPFRDYLNGRHGLVHCMVAAKPVDLLIISLGTNDLKYGTVYRSAKGLDALLDVAVHANTYMPGSSPVYRDEPRILVISPIALHEELDRKFPGHEMNGKLDDSRKFAAVYREVCQKWQVYFLDAAQTASASEIDCVHMDAVSHAALTEEVYHAVQKIMR
ncbi:MAG: G-D-S-L family lipolytic protein [Butyricicoccus sp.]|nr:G-D-S-L family lipolytic protein [Butyricicoccus sp.]